MTPVIFDMETGDIDDAFTLFWLCDNPKINLVGVTVAPGTQEQCNFVRTALEYFCKDIPIGTYQTPKKDHPVPGTWNSIFPARVTGTYTSNLFGKLSEKHPDLVYLGGAPMKNLGAALVTDAFYIKKMVQQGGFVGEPIVPKEKQLTKFAGMDYCPTWNLGGSHREAQAVLQSTNFGRKIFVGKNVCHACVATPKLIEEARNSDRKSLKLLADHVQPGKALHDLLAAAVIIREDCVELKPVNLNRNKKGFWGSTLTEPNCEAAVTWDPAIFLSTLIYP